MPPELAARNLLLLPRLLCLAGVAVDAERARLLLRALAEIDWAREADVRAACRAVLVNHPADLARFEETFELFWAIVRGARGAPAAQQARAVRREDGTVAIPLDEAGAGAEPARRRQTVRVLASSEEVLRQTDFADMTAAERAAALRFVERLAWSPGLAPSRRFRPADAGGRLDARATFRGSLRSLGEPIDLLRRRPRAKRRPLVLLCDVSGSMEAYVRLLLHMTHALARGWGRVEAFTFGTRLTRITRHLRDRRADRALRKVAAGVRDWSGGTRIAESLGEFNARWSRRVLGHGAVVLLCSDGWERGDVSRLAAEAARLQRASYRLLWLNPLAGTRGYALESAGARALAARVDDHLPANTLNGLMAIADLLAIAGRGRPVRRQVTR
ncbi:MAG: hypothetical protein AUH85_12360 [Chloroflexi bacterium 13_1_40CM_4_68_4]|nr:MAG: hypothetical protein AUH85_12360 [Chloroflexi bacterium 13_1_40CM_4_68_4]